MRLRAWKLFLLSTAFALAAALPPALAQSPSGAELDALNDAPLSIERANMAKRSPWPSNMRRA